jgi:pyruvate,water dikinase
LIGEITHSEKTGTRKKINIALIGPGRWGTTTPSLGVPVSFSEINTVSVLCEIAYMHEGLIPDVSLGTHFFNDLVEMNMIYFAIYPDKKGYFLNSGFFDKAENKLAELHPNAKLWANVIKVIDIGEEDFKFNGAGRGIIYQQQEEKLNTYKYIK